LWLQLTRYCLLRFKPCQFSDTLTHGHFRNYPRGQGHHAYFRLPVGEGLCFPTQNSILNEAKGKASDLPNLYPAFERAIKKLPEKDNGKVFDMWYAPLATVDKFTFWAEGRKRILDLRLQNAPEDDGMTQF